MSALLDRLAIRHRREQRKVRASFLREYLETWDALSVDDLDGTFAAWVRAVMRSLRRHRRLSAELAATHHLRVRLASAPMIAERGPAYVPPPVPLFREAGQREQRFEPQTGLTQAERDRLAELLARGAMTRAVRQAASSPSRPARRSAVEPDEERPVIIDWTADDKAAETALLITGPNEVKRRIAELRDRQAARRKALELSSGTAARHVLAGGRKTELTLVKADPAAIGWVRVTGQSRTGPCSFCVMLASRGVDYRPYRTKAGASFLAHDLCQCTAEPVFSRDDWAFRDQQREWKALWDEVTAGYSGQAARNAFRRHWERLQREGQPLPGLTEAA